VLEALPPSKRGTGLTTRVEKYPYDSWFDGRVYLLIPGEDFTAKPESLLAGLYGAAKRRGIKIATRTLDEGVAVQKLSNGSAPAAPAQAPVQEPGQTEAVTTAAGF
jgi:hypothetical protein